MNKHVRVVTFGEIMLRLKSPAFERFFQSPALEATFGGGLIYGLNTYEDEKQALEFAVAASCLKHTISGDYNRVSVAEVESLMKGSGNGRVQR